MSSAFDPAAIEHRWIRRIERERRARALAEQVLETRSRELWQSSQALKTERGLLVTALWTSNLQVWEWSSTGDTVVTFSPDRSGQALLRSTRQSMSELMHLLEPRDLRRFRAAWDALATEGAPLDVSVRIRGANGPRWFNVVGRALAAEGSTQARRIVGTFRDVSEEVTTSSVRTLHEQLVAGRSHPWFTCDGTGRIVGSNPAAAALLGPGGSGAIGSHIDAVLDWSRVVEQLAKAEETAPHQPLRLDLGRSKQRFELHCRTFLDPVRLEPRILVELEPLTQQAETDPVTGLPNRHTVQSWLESDAGEHPMRCAVLVGLTRFAGINERYGAASGDLVLEAVGKRLGAWLHEGDRIARWDGDRFLVLSPTPRDPERLQRFARALLEVLEVPLQLSGRDILVSARAAVSTDAADGAELVRQAEMAYEAARRGKQLLMAFHPRMSASNDREEEVGAALRQALRLGHLQAWFQPKLMSDGNVGGWEALCRWPEGAPVGTHPGEFIPIAEHLGLDVELTATMLEQAVYFAAQLKRLGRLEPVSVNLSVSQVMDPALPARLASACAKAGLPTHLLALELTESSLVEDQAGAKVVLESLRRQGHRIMLDDFGTGFSALSYLRNLPFDAVKIDRSFLQDIESDPKAVGLLEGTIQLIRSLGMRVVVEGVEREDQWTLLRRHGVDLAQGFLFSPALPSISAAQWAPASPGRTPPTPEYSVPNRPAAGRGVGMSPTA